MTTRLRFLCFAAMAAILAASCDGTTTTAPSTTATSGTETFVGQFGVGGSASRTIVASASGEIALTLREAGPPTDIALGLGIGIPSANNVGCHQTRTVVVAAASTPHLVATVDAGTYCVRVFDAGTMTTPIAFSIAISHP
jgi:hypothetical protein